MERRPMKDISEEKQGGLSNKMHMVGDKEGRNVIPF